MLSRRQAGRTTHTDDNLSNHDTDDLEVGDRGDPVLAALCGVVAPALRPNGSEEGLEVADGEEDVALETKTSTRENGILPVPGDWAERILLDHAPEGAQLSLGLGLVDLVDKGEALANRQVGPVGAVGGVGVVGLGKMTEDLTLVVGGVGTGKVGLGIVAIVGQRAVRGGDLANGDVVLVAVEGRHDG